MTDVILDNQYIGDVDDGKIFVDELRQARRNNKLPKFINFFYNNELDEVWISSITGRALRPLIVVENGRSKLDEATLRSLENNELNWQDLLDKGIIELLDSSEEENALTALNEEDLTNEHTHLEINPIVILGLTTSLVPYANFGQSSRLNRGSKTQKQALGLYATNFLMRMDTDVNLLHYPQTPIVRSFMHEISGYNKHPSGQNVIIAVMSYKGYNMSDSIIFNKASINRGLARSTYFKPYSVEELRYPGGLVDEICIPDKEVKGYRSESDYKFLEDDGIVYHEASLQTDDVIIGKTSPPRFLGELEEFSITASTIRESSVAVKQGEQGVVDFVLVTENEEGNKLVQVRLRDQRIPEIGDKFASRHGQKGVIGLIIQEADMPFTSSGIIPDIIFSPHSLPSRMTVSHIIEVIAGKVGALTGNYIDGSAFNAHSEASLRKELVELGFRENGTERMYNGVTGEELEVTIFIGSMYYMKLKHMVANRLHIRASGRIQLLTRQPIEGRAKGGGLRLGEMEKDCFVAHGASLLLKERFDSDKVLVYICNGCGMFAINDSYRNKRFCAKCGSNVEIDVIELSYAFKLLIDELKSLCIYPRIKLENKY